MGRSLGRERSIATMRRGVMRIACLVASCLLGACGHSEIAPTTYPFQNPDLALEARADNIVSLLTLDEKIACLGTNPNVPRLGIKGSDQLEGLHGLALETGEDAHPHGGSRAPRRATFWREMDVRFGEEGYAVPNRFRIE
jgi:hypothetical protein